MYSVLIADDESIIRKGLKSFVEREEGFEVKGLAEDGQDALMLAEEVKPDLCFVDINMPFMNGLDFIERLTKVSPDSICVVITGYDDFGYIQRALRLHVKDYLLKPISEEDFKKLMERLREILKYRKNEGDIRNWQENTREKLDEGQQDDSRYSENIKAARAYVKQHYHDPDLSLNEVAEAIHVSGPYLSKRFKEETGDSFLNYIQRLRLSKAMSMLSDESKAIYEIAFKCGYSSQHYFSTAFKKELNMSPADYRKSVLRKDMV
jgi:YesN/AraC family two-component response regulator